MGQQQLRLGLGTPGKENQNKGRRREEEQKATPFCWTLLQKAKVFSAAAMAVVSLFFFTDSADAR